MRAIDAVFRWPRSYLEELIPDLELGSSLGGFVRPAGPMFGDTPETGHPYIRCAPAYIAGILRPFRPAVHSEISRGWDSTYEFRAIRHMICWASSRP